MGCLINSLRVPQAFLRQFGANAIKHSDYVRKHLRQNAQKGRGNGRNYRDTALEPRIKFRFFSQTSTLNLQPSKRNSEQWHLPSVQAKSAVRHASIGKAKGKSSLAASLSKSEPPRHAPCSPMTPRHTGGHRRSSAPNTRSGLISRSL